MLLEHPGEVITREDLEKRLWPVGTYVDYEHSVNAVVKRLRQALRDSADSPLYIETIPRHGYRFIAPLQGAPSRVPLLRRPKSKPLLPTRPPKKL
jgi:cholera toxin transcriptional activator